MDRPLLPIPLAERVTASYDAWRMHHYRRLAIGRLCGTLTSLFWKD